MSVMDNKRNNRIEEMLSSLDGCKRAEAPDFFYTRLRAKMLARHEGGKKGISPNNGLHWKLKPVYILTSLLLVIAVNVFVFLRGRDETTTVTTDNNESFQQSIAAEYNLNDNITMYDLNQDK